MGREGIVMGEGVGMEIDGKVFKCVWMSFGCVLMCFWVCFRCILSV